MNQRLTDALYRDFPLLYCDCNESMSITAMCWGFQCGDGWEPLIRSLSGKLESEIIKIKIKIKIKLDYPEEEYLPRATTVKEKYGTLSFYISTGTDEMYFLIDEAEKQSARV